MYLNWSTSVPYIFFRWWTADTPFTFTLATLLIFAQSFCYEALINARARYDARLAAQPGEVTLGQRVVRSSMFMASNLASLYLMMIFMTYNGILCAALVLGAGCGHLFWSVWLPEGELGKRPRACCG